MGKIEYDFYGISNKDEFESIRKLHPELPRSILIKIDLLRRGVKFTERAKKEALNEANNYRLSGCILFQVHKKDETELLPHSFSLDDGTATLFLSAPDKNDPYLIDLTDDGEFYIYFSDGAPLARIHFHEKPGYYDKKTRSGELMQYVGYAAGTDSILFCPLRYCHYWSDGNQCVFCDITRNASFQKKAGRGFKARATPEDFYDTMLEVLKEGWRWRHFFITGGSDPRDDYAREYSYHLEVIKAMNQAGRESGIERVPLLFIGSPLSHEQFVHLREAGLSSYGFYFEIWDKEHFKYTCPGKAKYQGWDTFMEGILDAVTVFGRGNVCAGFVPGTEMMPEPYGFGNDIDAALSSSLEGYERLLENGIALTGTNLDIEPGTKLYEMGVTPPPLEFFVRLEEGRLRLLKKYKVSSKYMCWKHQCYGVYADCQRYI